jgi:hypothetical protein
MDQYGMDQKVMMRFSFTFFFMSYGYIILLIKTKKRSLKDLLIYVKPTGLIYSKIKLKPP